MTQLNGSRLRLARGRRGWSASKLAREMNVTLRTVQRWEREEVEPAEDSVTAIARLLDFREGFFYGDDVEPLAAEDVSFRALSKMSAGVREGAIAAGRIGTEIGRWIQAHYVVPSERLPTLTGYDPEMAAGVMRARWGLGDAPIPNLLHLLEAHGVRVFGMDPNIQEVDAFSFTSKFGPVIFLNTSKTGERQRFDLAHELGHLVLHQEAGAATPRATESEAHGFAASFLMPRSDVVAQPLWRAGMRAVLDAKARWRVSAMALAHRLRELDMLTEWSYRDLCISLSKEGYRTKEEYRPIVPESSLLFKKLLGSESARMEFMSLAEDLGLTNREFKRYVFGLFPTAIDGGGPWDVPVPDRAHSSTAGGSAPALRVVKG
ncbi:XRE family transcriptional regulator [Janibacter hoylei]|uniref:XRE family transcriptional regulator n=1 Tax=Janibacter hoylei TaxID=364298 RepID=UPI0027BAAD10|nr:XRE family transcriptional regulator [Janibacter hoylei]